MNIKLFTPFEALVTNKKRLQPFLYGRMQLFIQ
jgi:hypothetical protein